MSGKERFNVVKKYNLPLEVKFCKKCIVSNQRPRIRFDKEGVCSACRFAEKREKALKDLLDKYRRKDGYWDVVVPSSGGKDSGYVAHTLKYKYNMRPLTVTWAPNIFTEVGWRNLQHMIHSGIDNILGTPNGKVHRLLTKLSFENIGEVFQPFIYGQKAFPMQIAVKHKIPLVMFGENGEVEYGGDAKNEDSPAHNITDDMVKHYFSGILPNDWVKYGIEEDGLRYYLPPTKEEANEIGLENHFFGYYNKWIPRENYHYVVKHIGFKGNPDGRSEGTYTMHASLDDKIAGFHNYLAYIKFGLGRASSDAAHEIRDGHITREEGVSFVRKYDGEFPKKYFKEFLKYIDIEEQEFWEIVDRFRSDHLWEMVNDEWRLKQQVS